MKITYWALVLLGVAVLLKLSPEGGGAVSWPVDQHTHRAVSLNVPFFWAALIAVAVLVTISIIQ